MAWLKAVWGDALVPCLPIKIKIFVGETPLSNATEPLPNLGQ